MSNNRSDCPISYSLDIWGDKWSLLIIRDLLFNKQLTYGDFLRAQEGISTNILAARLLRLEEQGLIDRMDHPESKAKVLYRLTPKGIGLLPVLVEINQWAHQYFPVPESRKAMYQAIKKDKAGFIKATTKALMKK